MIEVEDDMSANMESWEGNVNALKNHTDRAIEKSHGILRNKIDRLSERLSNADKRTFNQEQEMRGQIQRLTDSQEKQFTQVIYQLNKLNSNQEAKPKGKKRR